MSRQDAEALGIQLDPVEPAVEDQQEETSPTEDAQLHDMEEQENQLQDGTGQEMQQPEELSEFQAENQEMESQLDPVFQTEPQGALQPEEAAELQQQFQSELEQHLDPDLQNELQPQLQQEHQSELEQQLQHGHEEQQLKPGLEQQLHPELQPDLQPHVHSELQAELQQELQSDLPPELQTENQETLPTVQADGEPEKIETGLQAITVPEGLTITSTSQVKETELAKEEDTQTTTVSLDAVSQQLGEDGSESSANDVLSNIIQSLFNPNEPNQSNVSIVPRMVGGKRKLCLRLPASTASALLAQTGSPLATSFTEGGIPKKIKIVIPPNSMSSGAGGLVSGLANSSIMHESKFTKISLSSQSAHSGKTTGPARLDPDSLPSSSSLSLMSSSPAKSSSKPFLASLFSTNSSSVSSSSASVTPVNQQSSQQTKKPLGSTENPIQLVQEGNSFRSLQPLTPDQLKHIASVLKQNRQAILSGTDGKMGGAGGVDGEGGKRRVVYDAASNTRIVYRVVTPGELKKTPSMAGVTSSTTVAAVKSTPVTPLASPVVRGRGRGRGRPPRTIAFNQPQRKPVSPEESDSEDLGEDETSLGLTADMSKVTTYLILHQSFN